MFKGLFLDGTSWATTTNPNITGDLTVEFELWKEDWVTGSSEDISAVYEGASEHSWIAEIDGDGFLKFWWSEDGSTNLSVTSVSIPDTYSSELEQSHAFKIEVDVDPGDITFYHWNGTSWDQIYTENVGIISLHSSTADLEVGSRNNGQTARVSNAVIKYLKVYSGISTTIVVDARFEAEARGVTQFTDNQSNVWTLSDNAAIIDGQTPNLDLYVPAVAEIAKEWAIPDTPGDLAQANMEAIDAFVGDLEFTEQDAVIQNSQGEGPFDADDSQKVKWRVINGFVFAVWDIHLGDSHDIDPTGFIELELPVAADTSFHDASIELAAGDIVGEGFLYDSSAEGSSELCNVQLRSSTRIRMPIETGNSQDYLTGDDPWVPANGDAWNVHAIYKAAS